MLKPLFNWFRLRRLEKEFDRELKYHVDRRIDDFVRDRVQ